MNNLNSSIFSPTSSGVLRGSTSTSARAEAYGAARGKIMLLYQVVESVSVFMGSFESSSLPCSIFLYRQWSICLLVPWRPLSCRLFGTGESVISWDLWDQCYLMLDEPRCQLYRAVVVEGDTAGPKLVEVYGEKCMDIKKVRKWCREFNEGPINVHDEQRSGRPSLPESTVARIDEMVRANRRITLEEIEDGLNEDCSHFSVHKIVSETLGYRKVSARDEQVLQFNNFLPECSYFVVQVEEKRLSEEQFYLLPSSYWQLPKLWDKNDSLTYQLHDNCHYCKFLDKGRQNVHDDERSGRPVTATDNAAVAAVRNVVEVDRRVTIDEIMIRLPPGIEIGSSSIVTIMSDVFDFRKVCARWIPRLLSENHNQQRMEAARAFLEMHRRDGDQLFPRIVTGDESWVHHSTPETKRQSMVWKKSEESAQKKAKITISAGKLWLSSFGTVRVFYCLTTCPQILRLTLQARTTQTLLENFKWEIFTHTPYSPDLAPSDFDLFPALKLHLGGKHFANDGEVQAEANHWLRKRDTAWNNSGIKKLLQRFSSFIFITMDRKKVCKKSSAKKKMMSIELKREIIEKHEQGVRVVDLSRQYGRICYVSVFYTGTAVGAGPAETSRGTPCYVTSETPPKKYDVVCEQKEMYISIIRRECGTVSKAFLTSAKKAYNFLLLRLSVICISEIGYFRGDLHKRNFSIQIRVHIC
ncbi:hypothetical protein LAZ67_6003315 [Cordylochernes scorpioides]|uniref:Transposase n=1 Tax=Cordylochernes scorpioides TaxID=51811 RepID=A0ABY6KKH3_9ARAC|nr:hypothetical protein LAZ67_6003315 [Cordylochernes scorpioides]